MADETVVEVLTTNMSITSSSLDLEDTLLDIEERNIEGFSARVEDEDVALSDGLFVETANDGSGSGLVDDTENVETGHGTGVLGGLTLGVVEVCGNSDNNIVDSSTKLRHGDLLHLDENHGGIFSIGLKRSL